jgi:pimeloyl-ACP methyl ester carboxylesterase
MHTKLDLSISARQGVPLQNNNWHTLNDSPTVLIFVHGFFSSSELCWKNKNGVRWPDLVASDSRLRSPSIFMAGYYTDIDSGNYKISDCAREVYEGLMQPGINGEPPPISKSNIIFVCHSLGGIIARYMIERNRHAFMTKNISLILIASPSYGSEYANSLSGLISIYKNKIAKQLIFGNESLDDLDDRFRDLVSTRSIPNLSGVEAIEHHFPLHWRFVPGLKPIVVKDSASRYFGPSKLLKGTNHSSCVKPNNHSHVAHEFLVFTVLSFYKNFTEKHANVIVSEHQVAIRDKTFNSMPSLFEVYAPEYEPYYIAREIDNKLSESLDLFSLWIHGGSGYGKTASIRRKLALSKINSIYVYIGSIAETSEGHISLLREVYTTIVTKLGDTYKVLATATQLISEITRLLSRASDNGVICLAIDEIPLIRRDVQETVKFAQALNSLVTQMKQQYSHLRFRVVATSIFDPQEYFANDERRIYEQISFIKFERWSEPDVIKLTSLILEKLEEKIIRLEEEVLICESAGGSPRFIKTFFKNFSVTHGRNVSVKEVLRETKILLKP